MHPWFDSSLGKLSGRRRQLGTIPCICLQLIGFVEDSWRDRRYWASIRPSFERVESRSSGDAVGYFVERFKGILKSVPNPVLANHAENMMTPNEL